MQLFRSDGSQAHACLRNVPGFRPIRFCVFIRNIHPFRAKGHCLAAVTPIVRRPSTARTATVERRACYNKGIKNKV